MKSGANRPTETRFSRRKVIKCESETLISVQVGMYAEFR